MTAEAASTTPETSDDCHMRLMSIERPMVMRQPRSARASRMSAAIIIMQYPSRTRLVLSASSKEGGVPAPPVCHSGHRTSPDAKMRSAAANSEMMSLSFDERDPRASHATPATIAMPMDE